MADEPTLERLTRLAQSASVKLRVRSALNPLLWLNGIITPLCFGFAHFSTDGVQIALVSIGALPVISGCVAYFYFMVKSPNMLQSEDYQLRRQALELIQEKGSSIAVISTSVQAITNPVMGHLSGSNEEQSSDGDQK